MAEDSEFSYDPEKNYDEETLAQQREIEKEVAVSQSLIGEKTTVDKLFAEYSEEDEIYRHKVEDLTRNQHFLRKTRGDGNCFYRAFGYAYMERLIKDRTDLPRFKEVVSKSKDDLVSLGFPQFTIEDFHQTFMDLVNKVDNGCTLQDLLDMFNDQGFSDYVIVYLRLLVSGYLQKEADFYTSFIEGDRTVKEFCHQEVEPMGRESDHIHIIALTNVLGAPVEIVYMDREGGSCTHHCFPEDSKPSVSLLYRPGHYDILYS